MGAVPHTGSASQAHLSPQQCYLTHSLPIDGDIKKLLYSQYKSDMACVYNYAGAPRAGLRDVPIRDFCRRSPPSAAAIAMQKYQDGDTRCVSWMALTQPCDEGDTHHVEKYYRTQEVSSIHID
jgi:hypothetical protein